MNKEKANERRDRLAKELEDAYNNGGDYAAKIAEIESYGDTFNARILVKADGVVWGDGMWLTVAKRLPPKPTEWHTELWYVKVVYAR